MIEKFYEICRIKGFDFEYEINDSGVNNIDIVCTPRNVVFVKIGNQNDKNLEILIKTKILELEQNY